jgi:hypothetical protein
MLSYAYYAHILRGSDEATRAHMRKAVIWVVLKQRVGQWAETILEVGSI